LAHGSGKLEFYWLIGKRDIRESAYSFQKCSKNKKVEAVEIRNKEKIKDEQLKEERLYIAEKDTRKKTMFS
jgi:hypothetical protein